MGKRRRKGDPHTSRKKKVARYHCLTCGETKHERHFADFNPSAECEHLINTCKSCLERYVDTQIEDTNVRIGGDDNKTFGIRCPECPAIMKADDIETAASENMFARFKKLERIHIGNNTLGWRWCQSPSCDEGQVHGETPDEDESKTAKEEPNTTNICKCRKCGALSCVPCDRPYHRGESCKAYQLRIKGHVDEEDEALRVIGNITQPCPECGVRILKDGGCDDMECK